MAPHTMAPAERPLGHPLPMLIISTFVPISLVLIVHPLLPLFLPQNVLDAVPLPRQPTFPALQANIGFAMLAFVGAVLSVPMVGQAFIAKGLKGRDLLRPNGRTSGPWV
jgi:UDP-N-acetylglucosamine--dolichyl-phosphate N-acetylglucosaminephosphotransferase